MKLYIKNRFFILFYKQGVILFLKRGYPFRTATLIKASWDYNEINFKHVQKNLNCYGKDWKKNKFKQTLKEHVL